MGDLNETVTSDIIKEYDSTIDDGRSIIADICEVFHENEKIKFHVSGFGQDKWPVDCLYDLVCIMEQIPDILKEVNLEKSNFVLDFYEQGIERTINFNLKEDNYILTCKSSTDWKPNPEVVIVKRQDVKTMLEHLIKDFLELSRILCPHLRKQPLLVEWIF